MNTRNHHPEILIIALILNVGVFATWLAWRLQLPSIVVLLVCGSRLGRALVPPLSHANLESALPILLGSSVALIYCDGGRSLGRRPLV